jgi:hypothetical protein
MVFAQHCGKGYGKAWRGVLFRNTYKQLEEVVVRVHKWFYPIFSGFNYNRGDFTCRWASGEELLLRHMDKDKDYENYHGHEYPFVGWDELTNWATPVCYDKMKSCCRSSDPDVPRIYRSTTNPYGRGHNWVKQYFIDVGPPCTVYDATVEVKGKKITVQRTHIDGRYEENRALVDADPEYQAKIASGRDPMIKRAWLSGDWDIVSGGMFDDLWDREKHVIKPFPIPSSWEVLRAFDWGSAHPFSVGWWAVSDGTKAPNGTVYPRDSIFRIAEWYGWNGQPNEGCRMTATKIAEGIVEWEKKLPPVSPGPADSAIYNVTPGHKSIGQEMREAGVSWIEADKRPGSRKSGWEIMRNMLEAATADRLEKPGMWIFKNCVHFISQIPVLSRKENDPDDVDSDTEDHIADETRYMVLRRNVRGTVGRVRI